MGESVYPSSSRELGEKRHALAPETDLAGGAFAHSAIALTEVEEAERSRKT